ncbi:hypothetical protein [Rhodoferax ferrireducens]|uniref:hypothetical protein n=1 Tax=Rhodoferax ferrireducens TaxID=192843 RepID=UPI000E0DBEF7|nr:hypothetical protein [Rhodoferax ferrireducens]
MASDKPAAPYTGFDTPCVFHWRIAPAGRIKPVKPQINNGPWLTKQQQAVCALSTPQERRDLLAALAVQAAAKLDIPSSTKV